MTLLEQIKLALRIVADDFDAEIENDINACKIDLKRVGIVAITDTDAMIIRLIELYCKAALNFEQNGERYYRAYELMRDGVSLCGDYNAEAANV